MKIAVAEMMLYFAMREAQFFASREIRPMHLLLSMTYTREGAGLLYRLGLDLALLRRDLTCRLRRGILFRSTLRKLFRSNPKPLFQPDDIDVIPLPPGQGPTPDGNNSFPSLSPGLDWMLRRVIEHRNELELSPEEFPPICFLLAFFDVGYPVTGPLIAQGLDRDLVLSFAETGESPCPPLPSSYDLVPLEPGEVSITLFNDDTTTMSFVIDVLEGIFGRSCSEAFALIQNIHEDGSATIGFYSRADAEKRVLRMHKQAKRHGFPLRVEIT